MSNKFKVGDRVVRQDEHHILVVGKEYIIAETNKNGWVQVEGYDGWLVDQAFTLAPSTFKNMYFKVESPEHSRAIQSWLFEQGYKWPSCSKGTFMNAHFNFIVTHDKGGLTYSYVTPNPTSDLQEHTLSYEIETEYTITDVSPVEKKERIELNGKMYDKEVLEKALSGLEEVEE
jgi:hypothetical protein